MGRMYKTAQGKMVDVDSIRLVNESTIAVGNMKVNARGDQLGSGGKVVQTRNQTMDQYYKLNTPVATESRIHEIQKFQAQHGARSSQGTATPNVANIPDVDPSGESFDPVDDAAQIPVAPMRGSLADSIAKTVTVDQETLTPLSRTTNKGPSRI